MEHEIAYAINWCPGQIRFSSDAFVGVGSGTLEGNLTLLVRGRTQA